MYRDTPQIRENRKLEGTSAEFQTAYKERGPNNSDARRDDLAKAIEHTGNLAMTTANQQSHDLCLDNLGKEFQALQDDPQLMHAVLDKMAHDWADQKDNGHVPKIDLRTDSKGNVTGFDIQATKTEIQERLSAIGDESGKFDVSPEGKAGRKRE